MRTFNLLLIVSLLFACSCATKPLAAQRWRCFVEYSLDGASADFLKVASINEKFSQLGISVISDGDGVPDYSIDVDVSVLDGFTTFSYAVSYKDTLYSVTLECQVDGALNQSKTDMALAVLNNELAYILSHFPKPSGSELQASSPNIILHDVKTK